ncbi:hypothetical protein [uncultured Cetobacterium sp.]|uniref:hypothetical protein n=1 Tax=uncultured Cetobacterium sp. TaxID=527638 RepID=UPI0025D6C7E8|nr:hypothetical protein [uncultured Cetobacterium sp.]
MAEEQHEKGRQYLEYFNGLLTLTLAHLSYKKLYDAYKNPKRLIFKINGKEFSFDTKATIQYNGEQRDVWVESKGYSQGGALLDYYKDFIRRVYETIVNGKTNEDDIFIFVTNVSFGTTKKNLFKREFVLEFLITQYGEPDFEKAIQFEKVSKAIFAIIFTDSYIDLFMDRISFEKNEKIWDIWANRNVKLLDWETFCDMIRIMNPTLENLDKVKIGEEINIPKMNGEKIEDKNKSL